MLTPPLVTMAKLSYASCNITTGATSDTNKQQPTMEPPLQDLTLLSRQYRLSKVSYEGLASHVGRLEDD